MAAIPLRRLVMASTFHSCALRQQLPIYLRRYSNKGKNIYDNNNNNDNNF